MFTDNKEITNNLFFEKQHLSNMFFGTFQQNIMNNLQELHLTLYGDTSQFCKRKICLEFDFFKDMTEIEEHKYLFYAKQKWRMLHNNYAEFITDVKSNILMVAMNFGKIPDDIHGYYIVCETPCDSELNIRFYVI